MLSDQDCTTHLKHVKFIQLKEQSGEKNQSSIETDIYRLQWPSNRDTFMYLEDMSHLLLTLRDLIQRDLSNKLFGSWLKFGAAVSNQTLNIGSERVQFLKMRSWFLEAKKMETLQVLLIYSTHSRIKFKRQEAFLTKIHSIKEHFCAKTIRYMPMDMKMTTHTFIILLKNLGKKND